MKSRFIAASCLAAVVMSSIVMFGADPALATSGVPYKDPTASGSITLCNRDLQPITTGSINDIPFAWRAVGSESAPAPYNADPRAATLFYFQPQKGQPAGDWIGRAMNGAATYTNPDVPMSQSTVLDHPLKDLLEAYPATWNGFVQLRLIYTTLGQPASPVYAATDIKVTGDTWEALNPGNASCDSGNAVSSEVAAVPNFEKSAKAAQKKIDQQQAKSSASASPSGQPTSSASEPSGSQKTSAGATQDSSTAPASKAPLIVILLLFAGAALALVIYWQTHKRSS